MERCYICHGDIEEESGYWGPYSLAPFTEDEKKHCCYFCNKHYVMPARSRRQVNDEQREKLEKERQEEEARRNSPEW